MSQTKELISSHHQSAEQYDSYCPFGDKLIVLLASIESRVMVSVPKRTMPKGMVPRRIVSAHSGYILPVVLMLMVMISVMTLSALSRASLLQKRLAYSQQMSELDGVALRYLKRCEDDIYQQVISTPNQFNSLQHNYIRSSLEQNPRAWLQDYFVRDYLTLEFNLANQGLVQCAAFIMPTQDGAAFADHHILSIYLEATRSNLRRRYRSDVFI